MIGPKIIDWTANRASLSVSLELIPFKTKLSYLFTDGWRTSSNVDVSEDLARVLTYLVVKHSVLSALCAHYKIHQPTWIAADVEKDLAEIEVALR